jgi:ribosome-associated toxin RatA of RatAB toxin-antitoxin module
VLERIGGIGDTAAMRELKRSALVRCTPEAAWAVVSDVLAYPDFVPGCSSAQLLRTEGEDQVIRVGVRHGALHSHFTTRNRHDPPRSLGMQLVDGPFKALDGRWQITPLGADGCQIELLLRYQFSNPLKAALLQPVFAGVADQMVKAFVQRLQA